MVKSLLDGVHVCCSLTQVHGLTLRCGLCVFVDVVQVARLRAENEALRSGLNTLVTVMDDTRRAALAATGEGAQKDTAAMGGGGHEAAIRAAEEGGRVVRECVERLAGQVQSRGAELTAMQQATAGTPTRRKISFCECVS